MPSMLGIERINARKQQPNPRIAFIRPMEGPHDRSLAEHYLSRLAASVVPIMKKHFLSVTALCDFPSNKEFLGRNFNGGERIDLVLKDSKGNWLPFKFVQGVLIHELAHNGQMNHSKKFWALRQIYHDELKMLWERGYTGEGLWGRGVDLKSGMFMGTELRDGVDLPEHLCGGTYRSSRKRKKNTLSYKEKKERRIAKKFGVNGQALGADEETKVKLEKGKKQVAKPRVAGSARGRELRAAAALARFETKKEEPVKEEEESDDSSETEGDEDSPADEAVDIDGKKLVDEKGLGVIKICEDEDVDEAEAQNEMAELQGFGNTRKSQSQPSEKALSSGKSKSPTTSSSKDTSSLPNQKARITINGRPLNESSVGGKPTPNAIVIDDEDKKPVAKELPSARNRHSYAQKTSDKSQHVTIKIDEDDISTASEDDTPEASKKRGVSTAVSAPSMTPQAATCPICSMENSPDAATCLMCSHVLQEDKVVGVWKCKSSICKDSEYLNCKDVALCGVCGERQA